MSRHARAGWVLAGLGALASCRSEARAPVQAAVPPLVAGPAPRAAAGPAAARRLVIVLGDSLTAGLGLDGAETYPALLEARLERERRSARVVNAGVSGDTTAGGLARLPWLLAQHPDLLVVELGINDGLRGMPLETIRGNLRTIVETASGDGVRVLLVGMLLPPSYGVEYAQGFAAIYPTLARELDVPLVPFLLAGVAGREELNLGDGVHPNARGHELLLETVYPHIVAELAR